MEIDSPESWHSVASRGNKRSFQSKSPARKPAAKSASKSASKTPAKSTKRVPAKVTRAIAKRVPKPITPVRQLSNTIRQLQKQQKTLQGVARELSNAKRALKISKRPDTIKAVEKRIKQAAKDVRKETRQVQRTVKATEKLAHQVFNLFRKKSVPKRQRETANRNINQAGKVIVRVDKQVVKAKIAAPVQKRVAKKAAKKISKKQVKKVVQPAPKPAAKKAGSKSKKLTVGFHKSAEIKQQVLQPGGPSTDGKELLGDGQVFAHRVVTRHGAFAGNEVSHTLQELHDKAAEYIERKTPTEYLQFGIFQMPQRKGAIDYYKKQKENERAAHQKVKEQEQKMQEQEQRIKQLEAELAAKKALIRKVSKRNRKGNK